jgi:octaprenyl-diphosphate synthase
MLALTPTDSPVHAALSRSLAEVERRFAAELLSDLPNVNSLAEHVERYRGKMLRPTLVIASAMAAYPEAWAGDAEFADRVVTVATVAEMVHMATLVHDDILDEAEMRRRGATINHLRGNEAAVMLGDYLISHAYHLCSAIPLPAASRAIAAATNTVCEGELLQLHHRERWDLTERTYFEIIRRKTASLCGTCCRLPAVLISGQTDGGGPPAEDLYAFGQKLGVAFQIVDDVLDLTGRAEQVGKTVGRDLAKGKLTLPVIHHLQHLDESARASLIQRLIEQDEEESGRILRQELARSASLDYARQWAGRLVADAKTAVQQQLPEGEARQLLLTMADAVVSRRF